MLLLIASASAVLLTMWAGLLWWFRRPLAAYWHEPVFRLPVLIFESDDWGPGPPAHAEALSSIAKALSEFRDHADHPPVTTLGVVLAIPKRDDGDSGQPQEQTLNDADFGAIRAAMQAGVDSGVFQLQLHGRSHYWLAALAEARRTEPVVARWLAGSDTWRTEALPAGLQSRWAPEVGGAQFPISDDATRTAAEAEARLFQECFGTVAAVAVPTTFVWTAAAERGWAATGVRAVVTPGRHYTYRGRFADPGSAPLITNGMRANGIRYVVRDQYFEPFKGHSADDGLRALAANTALGRPTLLEIHRVNFLEPALRERSLMAIRELLSRALSAHPNVRFLSTVELVDVMEAEVADLIDRSMRGRLAAWCGRARTVPRFWRLARLSGLALLIAGAGGWARNARSRTSGAVSRG